MTENPRHLLLWAINLQKYENGIYNFVLVFKAQIE